jgi:excisionase family DNA binding protein
MASTNQRVPAERAAYSIPEVCSLTGLGRDTVYRAIRERRLVGRKLGRRTLVTNIDLQKFLNALPRMADAR